MNPEIILKSLKQFTDRERIEFLPLAPDAKPVSDYAPIHKYALDLKNGAKPETAAEDLFTALWKDVLGVQPTRQVGVTEGFVDFMVPERLGDPLPLELKPLFQRAGPDALWRKDANPKHHVVQVKKYLRDHEYLILTDLRTAWFFCARDFFFEEKPFATLPFDDFLNRCRETRSVLDTLRRVEDTCERPELEQQFFEDLKIWYNEFDKVKWVKDADTAETIILLINKLIFARTIEDFGLIPYRFTQDEYIRQTQRWEAKGAQRIVPKFLEGFEDFFDEYYDTEIFSARVWERLDKDPANLQRFCEKLNFVLGVNSWDETFSRGIVHYNYRRIDEDIFGKSYEMFLASNRKDEGIYYTPAGITGPMADSLVNSLAGKLVDEICAAVGSQKCNFKRADQLMAQLAEIRVADTACGSGGFLIKVLRAFWRQYRRIDAAGAWVQKILKPENGEMFLAEMPPNVEAALAFRRTHNFDTRRILIAQILLRHIFGGDKDPGALEVAKTNIWKEAVKLSPADYNYRELKTDVVKILPNLELNFHCADSLVDVELEKQAKWLAEYHQAELKKLAELRARYIANPMLHAPLDEALALRQKVRASLVEHFQTENLPGEPGGFALHFWPCWFHADGSAKSFGSSGRESAHSSAAESAAMKKSQSRLTSAATSETPAGFDGIIGNPPWEGFKPIRKEFAASFYRGKPQFSKMGMDGPTFEKWFHDELKDNPEFAANWREHEDYYERHKEYFGRAFQKQGTGDWNLFKLFIERDLSLVRHGGQFSLLVPSSIQTDEGCSDLRRWFITENRLDELTSFENRGYKVVEDGKEKTKQIFPDVDSRFKFGFFKVVKGATTAKDHAFDARFYLHDPKDAFAPPIRYSVEMLRRFSPEMISVMEFRSPEDYAVVGRIRGEHKLLGELSYQFRRELHPADDVKFYLKDPARKLRKGESVIYEGKMIQQFDDNFAARFYHAEDEAVRPELLRKELYRLGQFIRESEVEKVEGKKVPTKKDEFEKFLAELWNAKKFQLDCDFERVGYRRIGRSTDERTIIATLLSPGVYFSDTVSYLIPANYRLTKAGKLSQEPISPEDARSVLCLLDSLTLNYYIRSKISATLNMFYMYELPVPELFTAQKKKLAEFAATLLKNPRDVKERAALEAFIARELYGLPLEDWKHLTGTFTFGSGETKAELDEIIRLSLMLWT
ncbi:MAG: N-6 DNA methylase [Verrucomicrobia subdivision 3 bacterium]|nr:N-6 DNA methylase [Limisphaerales bacterium]